MKENIYNYAIKHVKMGASFHVSFEKRSFRIGKKVLIENGQIKIDGAELGIDTNVSVSEAVDNLEVAFLLYQRSCPSSRSEKHRKLYFGAMSLDELTNDDLINAEQREIARLKLELLVLAYIMSGTISWSSEFTSLSMNPKRCTWFWESRTGLVLLKDWFCLAA